MTPFEEAQVALSPLPLRRAVQKYMVERVKERVEAWGINPQELYGMSCGEMSRVEECAYWMLRAAGRCEKAIDEIAWGWNPDGSPPPTKYDD